jgi:hypothetical protein
MYESSAWDFSRYTILIVVLALHLALVALLARASRIGTPGASIEQSVEVLFLPPPILPKVRSENARLRRERRYGNHGRSSRSGLTPAVNAIFLQGRTAEAQGGLGGKRVALQSVRDPQPSAPSNSSVSGGPAEEHWWPRGNHRVGEQYKTANGDWIVWINDNCYQIAVAGPSTMTPGAPEPQTICPAPSNAPRDP